VPAQGVVPARLPKVVNACSCMQLQRASRSLPLSRRRRRPRRPPLQLELPVATYTPTHLPMVSHLCLSSFHSPPRQTVASRKALGTRSASLLLPDVPEAAQRTTIHVQAQGSNHSDLGAVVLVTSYASLRCLLRSRCRSEPTHFISLPYPLLSILSYPHPVSTIPV
jgi:hypothetical protein